MKRRTRSSARLARATAAVIEPFERRTLMSAGALDPTFGTGGTAAITEYGPFTNETYVAVDAAGRELYDFTAAGGHSPAAYVGRLTAAGSPDPTFGTGGVVELTTGPDPNYQPIEGTDVCQIVPMPDGDVLAVSPQVVEELTPAGRPDTRFGGGGTDDDGLHTGFLYPPDDGGIHAVAVQADGKLVAAGFDGDAGTNTLTRFDADGSVDATYGTAGRVVLSTPAYASLTVGSPTLDAAGRVVVSVAAKATATSAATAYGVARVTAAGKLDPTFGTGGLALDPAQHAVGPVALAPNGTIYQATADALFAYSANGKHAAGGTVTSATAPGNSFDALAVGPDGKPVLAGYGGGLDESYGVDFPNAVVDRLLPINPAGTIAPTFDPTFATGGSASLVAHPTSVAFNAQGNIVLGLVTGVGFTADAAGDGAVARLLAGGPAPTPSVPLTGSLVATAGSYRNQGNTAAKAVDGDLGTFFDGPSADEAVVGVDLGSAKTISQIQFAPRPGFAGRMVGGQFQASNSPDFDVDQFGPTFLYTVTAAPPAGVLTTVAVDDATAYRYVRYVAPLGSFGNVAEVRFLTAGPAGTAAALHGTVIGTAGSYRGLGDTIADAFDGDPTTFFDGPAANGNVVGLDLGSAKAVAQVRFAPRAGLAGRMVGGTFEASTSPTFATFVTAGTVRSAPAEGVLTTLTLGKVGAYRYWRYVGPAGSFGNIAELEFDG